MLRRTMRGRLIAIACAISVLILGTPSPGSARHARWPGRTISYYNAADVYRWQVSKAVQAWNNSEVGIRFVRASSRSSAQLLIRTSDSLGDASGYATVGYVSNAEMLLASPRSRPSHVDKWTMARTAAHELGHVLGLVHEGDECSIMNFGGSLCAAPPLGKWRCRLTEAIDIRRVARRYGGPGAPVRQPATCYKWPIPRPATELTAQLRPANETRQFPEVALQWRNPSSKGLFRVRVNREKGRCPESHRDRGAVLVDEQRRDPFQNEVPRGKLDSTLDRIIGSDFGRFCYRAWTGEEAGRYGTRAPRVWVEIADTSAPPPPPPNDHFGNATPIFNLPFSTSVNLGSATTETGEPIPTCGSSARTVWFGYESEIDQTFTADTVGTSSSTSTRIAVFTGTSLDSLMEVACDAESDGLHSRVTVNGVAGQAYYLMVSVDEVASSIPVTFNVEQLP